MNNLQAEERRVLPRLPASLMVQYSSESLLNEGVATNLSPLGLFLESELLDVVGTRAWLQLSDGIGSWLTAVAEVVRTVEKPEEGVPGMGLRFLELGPGATRWIERYCADFNAASRVVIVDRDSGRLGEISQSVFALGARPLCLGHDLVCAAAIERLRPHAVVVGAGLGATRCRELIDQLTSVEGLDETLISLEEGVAKEVGLGAASGCGGRVTTWSGRVGIAEVVERAGGPVDGAAGRGGWLH